MHCLRAARHGADIQSWNREFWWEGWHTVEALNYFAKLFRAVLALSLPWLLELCPWDGRYLLLKHWKCHKRGLSMAKFIWRSKTCTACHVEKWKKLYFVKSQNCPRTWVRSIYLKQTGVYIVSLVCRFLHNIHLCARIHSWTRGHWCSQSGCCPVWNWEPGPWKQTLIEQPVCFHFTNVPGRVITEVASLVPEAVPRVISVAVVARVWTTSSGQI